MDVKNSFSGGPQFMQSNAIVIKPEHNWTSDPQDFPGFYGHSTESNPSNHPNNHGQQNTNTMSWMSNNNGAIPKPEFPNNNNCEFFPEPDKIKCNRNTVWVKNENKLEYSVVDSKPQMRTQLSALDMPHEMDKQEVIGQAVLDTRAIPVSSSAPTVSMPPTAHAPRTGPAAHMRFMVPTASVPGNPTTHPVHAGPRHGMPMAPMAPESFPGHGPHPAYMPPRPHVPQFVPTPLAPHGFPVNPTGHGPMVPPTAPSVPKGFPVPPPMAMAPPFPPMYPAPGPWVSAQSGPMHPATHHGYAPHGPYDPFGFHQLSTPQRSPSKIRRTGTKIIREARVITARARDISAPSPESPAPSAAPYTAPALAPAPAVTFVPEPPTCPCCSNGMPPCPCRVTKRSIGTQYEDKPFQGETYTREACKTKGTEAYKDVGVSHLIHFFPF